MKQVAIEALWVLASGIGWLGCWILTGIVLFPLWFVMSAYGISDLDDLPNSLYFALMLVLAYLTTMLYVFLRQAVRGRRS